MVSLWFLSPRKSTGRASPGPSRVIAIIEDACHREKISDTRSYVSLSKCRGGFGFL
jgi:hypothetical protein